MDYNKLLHKYLLYEAGDGADRKKEWNRKRITDDNLGKRAHFLDKKFKFTPENLEKFKQLNTLFSDGEKRIYKACCKLERQLLKMQKFDANYSTDYEIEIELLFYSDAIRARYEKGDSLDYIYRSSIFLSFNKDENVKRSGNSGDKTNWNGFDKSFGKYIKTNERFGLNNQTRTFKSLVECSCLAYEDILQISCIQWDISVNYQYYDDITLQ